MKPEAQAVHDELRVVLRSYEFPASACGDRQVIKLTAEQLLSIMESSTHDIARYAHNRAVTACAEFLTKIGRVASAQLLHDHLRAVPPAVPVVEAERCRCGWCPACRDEGGEP